MVYAAQGKLCDLTTVPAVRCVGDLYCQLTGGSRPAGTCTPAPGAGQFCGSDGFNSTICAVGTTCNNGTCDVVGACGAGVKCDSAFYCAYVSSGLACAPLATAGQACGSSSAGFSPP